MNIFLTIYIFKLLDYAMTCDVLYIAVLLKAYYNPFCERINFMLQGIIIYKKRMDRSLRQNFDDAHKDFERTGTKSLIKLCKIYKHAVPLSTRYVDHEIYVHINFRPFSKVHTFTLRAGI